MSDDLRTDHVKFESPSILTKMFFFWPGHWGGAWAPLVYASVPTALNKLKRQIQIYFSQRLYIIYAKVFKFNDHTPNWSSFLTAAIDKLDQLQVRFL